MTVPGKDFGLEGYLRLSYAADTSAVLEGLKRIRWALDASTPKEIRIGEKLVTRDWL
jgi:aspartate aminotransferase